VLWALLMTESSLDADHLARFEPHVYDRILRGDSRYAEWTPAARASDDEARLLASSMGVGHVMGYNYRGMGYAGPLEALLDDHELAARYAARFYGNLVRTAPAIDDLDTPAQDVFEASIAAYNTGDHGNWPSAHMDRFRRWRNRYRERHGESVIAFPSDFPVGGGIVSVVILLVVVAMIWYLKG